MHMDMDVRLNQSKGNINISPLFLFEISSMILAYNIICDAYNMSSEERRRPDAGQILLDKIKLSKEIVASALPDTNTTAIEQPAE